LEVLFIKQKNNTLHFGRMDVIFLIASIEDKNELSAAGKEIHNSLL
jgi:hypothetical protein